MKRLLLFVIVLNAAPVQAHFDEQRKSVSYTAETLPSGQGEVGLGLIAYGATDSLMVSFPVLKTVYSNYMLKTRYKFRVNDSVIISPEIGFGIFNGDLRSRNSVSKPFHGGSFSGELHLTRNFEDRMAISVGVGIHRPGYVPYGYDLLGLDMNNEQPSYSNYLNYDIYTVDGDLFYFGITGLVGVNTDDWRDAKYTWGYVPYIGYTWAWSSLRAGVGAYLIAPYINLAWVF